MSATKGYHQIHEGDWIEPTMRGHINQCCDCALVHVADYEVLDKDNRPLTGVKVRFKLRVDRRRTAALRRKFKFKE